MTANQCHYYVEPAPEGQGELALNVAKYIYATKPPPEEVQVVLDMLAHAVHDLETAVANGFRDWKPKFSV